MTREFTPLLVTIFVTAPTTTDVEALAEAMVEVLMDSQEIAAFGIDSFDGVQAVSAL